MKTQFHAHTHIGRRTNNEDAFLASEALGLYIVADGMGGYEGGEIASHLAVTSMYEFYARLHRSQETTMPEGIDPRAHANDGELRLDAAVRIANRHVLARRHGRLSHMGSTVVAVELLAGGRAAIGHVGDSRVYRFRGGKLEVLTKDHSLYRHMAEAGADLPNKSEWSLRNVVTKALGLEDAAPELQTVALRPGDRLLLCTDGLYEPLPEDDIAFLLATRDPDDACETMVNLAYDLGGRDNITALVVAVDA